MSNSNGIISKPIDLKADIATVLGESSTNLGTLCKSAKVNKFSRVKPIIYASVVELTDAQRKSKNYGLTILGGSHGTMNIGHTPWTYNKPNGETPCRMSDFANYNHKATSPIKSIYWPEQMVSGGATDNFTFDVNFSFRGADESETMLGLDDVLPSDYYFALILTNGSKYYVKTSTQTMQYMLDLASSNRGYGVSINMGDAGFSTGDTVKAILCMADREITANYDNPTQATFYSLEAEADIDRKEYTLTKVYWVYGMKVTLTQNVTKSVSSSTGFVFKINSLTAKIEHSNSSNNRNFYIKAFLRIASSKTSTVSYTSWGQQLVSKGSLPDTITLDTGSSYAEYKSDYGYAGNFMIGVRVGTNDINDDEYGQDPNGSIEIAQIDNAFGPNSWGGVSINGYYGVTAELG